MFYGLNLLVLLFAALMLWCLLLIVEALKRRGFIEGENARKTIHIFSGFFLALLPVVANRREIIAVNILFFIGVLIFHGFLKKFSAIADIKRWSWGQFLYPLGLVIVAVLFSDPIIYSFATLELALADGFAAVIGHRFGKKTEYRLFGAVKTYLGSITFFLVTVTILGMYASNHGLWDMWSIGLIIAGSLVVTFLEASIGAGFDNLFIPIVTASILLAL